MTTSLESTLIEMTTQHEFLPQNITVMDDNLNQTTSEDFTTETLITLTEIETEHTTKISSTQSSNFIEPTKKNGAQKLANIKSCLNIILFSLILSRIFK